MPPPLQRSYLRQPAPSQQEAPYSEDRSVSKSATENAKLPTTVNDLPRPDNGPAAGSVGGLSRQDVARPNYNRLRASSSGLARLRNPAAPLSSGIPMAGNKALAKVDSKLAMPPPQILGRSQSVRNPMALRARKDSDASVGKPNGTPSAQRPATARPAPLGRSQTVVTETSSRLAGSASSRIPASPVSLPKLSNSIRSNHGRTHSVSTASTTQDSVPSPRRSNTMASMHSRSKSSGDTMVATKTAQNSEKVSSMNDSGPYRHRAVADIRGASAAATSSLPPSSIGAPKARPAFNILQQHYSPAKAMPKPPVPSSRPAPALEGALANTSVSSDMSKMQSELLYLTLLHQEAEPTLQKYYKTAHRSLSKGFQDLQQEIELCKETEQSYREAVNTQALVRWSEALNGNTSGMGQTFAEAVRSLSSCIHELAVLSGPEGRYSGLIREFTAWMEETSGTPRDECGSPDAIKQKFVDALSEEWHGSHSSIVQRVRLLEREIGALPQPPHEADVGGSGPALFRILRILQSITKGMKRELDVLLDLERQVLARETRRIEEAVEKLRLDIVKDRPARVAAWRVRA